MQDNSTLKQTLDLLADSARALNLKPTVAVQAELPYVTIDTWVWDPLYDNYQAFELMTGLELVVVPRATPEDNNVYVYYGYEGKKVVEPINQNLEHATRRAIARAAQCIYKKY